MFSQKNVDINVLKFTKDIPLCDGREKSVKFWD